MLVALVAVPILALLYAQQQRRRVAAEVAFVTPALAPSPLGRRPGWRRHAPIALLAGALVVLILAAARPQRSVTLPVKGAGIMLANDISSSMSATDVRPSRLGAAKRAALGFLARVPGSVSVGQIEFARHPTLLQGPTTDRRLAREAIARLQPGGGGTAIGDAIQVALHSLTTLRRDGKKVPAAILLLSDGASNVGVTSASAAQQARADHIPIYTIALGTARGTIQIERGGRRVTADVPVATQELAQIARLSGGRAYTAADSARASAIYAHLAKKLGTRRARRDITVAFVGAAVFLLLGSAALSLRWFARPI